MANEFKFFGSSCDHCIVQKPESEVIWTLEYNPSNWEFPATVGFLSGADIERYSQSGRVYKSKSTATCPEHVANLLTNGSLDELRKRWRDKEPKEIYGGTDEWIDLYTAFKTKRFILRKF